MKKEIIGIKQYPVQSNDVNAQAEMPVWRIAECLIDAASRHAEAWGFGYQDLKRYNQAWVLARLAFDMKRYPSVGDILTVETWVESVNKAFSSRNFKMSDQNGEVLGYGRSIWSIIDFETRQSVELLNYTTIGTLCRELECPIDRPGRIAPVKEGDSEWYKVRVSDIDVNRHLTTSKYISHLLDLFPLEKFDREKIYRFEIQFMSEVYFNETVQLLNQEVQEGEFSLELKNEAGLSCCRGKVIFVNCDKV